ncbi:hypothetical protein [Pseudarthrobacter sp. H2]|uniref:hypothetical protein n=1 Tax=Pseudarthrobacter sp. H2 TaxID=3418415 RepID=UPI003CEC7269
MDEFGGAVDARDVVRVEDVTQSRDVRGAAGTGAEDLIRAPKGVLRGFIRTRTASPLSAGQ